MTQHAELKSAAQKLLVLMRGVSGSGKSTKARQLGAGGAIFSTDDYFMKGGSYAFDPSALSVAHAWNQKRAADAMQRGVTPIVIDNTMVQAWEGKPYVDLALRYGYQIKIAEPESDLWMKFSPGMPDAEMADLAEKLAKRNSHGVPASTILRMLQNWQPNLKVIDIMKAHRIASSGTTSELGLLIYHGTLYRRSQTSGPADVIEQLGMQMLEYHELELYLPLVDAALTAARSGKEQITLPRMGLVSIKTFIQMLQHILKDKEHEKEVYRQRELRNMEQRRRMDFEKGVKELARKRKWPEMYRKPETKEAPVAMREPSILESFGATGRCLKFRNALYRRCG